MCVSYEADLCAVNILLLLFWTHISNGFSCERHEKKEPTQMTTEGLYFTDKQCIMGPSIAVLPCVEIKKGGGNLNLLPGNWAGGLGRWLNIDAAEMKHSKSRCLFLATKWMYKQATFVRAPFLIETINIQGRHHVSWKGGGNDCGLQGESWENEMILF